MDTRKLLMDEMSLSQQKKVAYVAYVAAILFAIHLVTYLIPAIRNATTASSPVVAELLALIGVAEHLLLFPVVAALPAPRWAKAAGYGWLVIDMASDIMQLNGVAQLSYLGLRYGGHISAAIWIAASAWQGRGALRVIGLILAIDLIIYSFIAFLPLTFIVLLPSLVLLPLWFVLVGRFLAGANIPDQAQSREDEQQKAVQKT
jgi:hypothetical protein